ncbi:MAG TPA: Hsp20/alpha crystallin family protein [Dehalococcoidia bacterium]|nr:Hsp20/alpha crystallin family protein [Dehalococcoidia bacterium]
MATNGKQLPVRRSLLEDLEDPFQTIRDLRWPFSFASLRPWLERETPAVDVFERDGKVVVKAEMPGIKPEDIEVKVADGQIVISGERKEESEVKQEDFYRCERSYGRIYRALTLPKGCDAQRAEATVKDGVLEVVVPKKAEASEKKVEVKSA